MHQLKGDSLQGNNPQPQLTEQMYPERVRIHPEKSSACAAVGNLSLCPLARWAQLPSTTSTTLQGWGTSFLLPCLKSSCALCRDETCREDCRNLWQREDFPASAFPCNGCCCWRGPKGLREVCCNWQNPWKLKSTRNRLIPGGSSWVCPS